MNFIRFISIFLIFSLFFVACSGKKSGLQPTVADIHNPASPQGVSVKEESNMPVLTFDKMSYDFGKVIQGERLSYTFKFKNTGKSNLIITNTTASCGCTTSIPPKAPIKPNEQDEIVVNFDSKGKVGKETFTIIIAANTYPVNTVLHLTAEVVIP